MKLFTATVITVLALTAVGVFHGLADEQKYEDRLKNIADLVNSQNLGWQAEVSPRFKGMSKAEIKHMMGAFMTDNSNLPHVSQVHKFNFNEVPATFSSQTKWPQCQSIKDIRDQANCGSCWAFGAVEAMSDRLCINGDNEQADALQIRISSEDLMTCCESCGNGCNGGYPSAAWDYFANTGIVTGWNYGGKNFCSPYEIHPCTKEYPKCTGDAPTPACKQSCIPGYTKSYNNDKHFGSTTYSVTGESFMKAEISKNGPIETAFSVYEDFMTYKSGVYWHRHGYYLGGHAVKIVGYGVQDGVKYWRVANSWNRSWGLDGFFLMRRGQDDCGFESQGVAGGIQK